MKFERFGRLLARHRRSSVVRRLDRYVIRMHQAIENRDYDPRFNGEYRVLDVIRRHGSAATIVDVGANVGDWTRKAAQCFPEAAIHAFEIVPDTYVELSRRVGGLVNVKANPTGLSDSVGEIEVFCSPRDSQLASAVKGISEQFHHDTPRPIFAAVTTGARYCAERGISSIDMLKVDVEGMEDRVLKGFHDQFRAGVIRVLQFEYGYVNAATGFLLRDFYRFLRPLDMRIGKIYPDHVDFREYHLTHEDFLGPNYLAVHAACGNLIDALANRQRR